MRKYTSEQLTKSFWDKVNKNGTIPEHCPELGNCWEWQAYIMPCGYGQFGWLNNKIWLTHRLSWVFANGEISNEICVLHKCDNRKCVNPNHLFLGTRLDNAKDMVSKDRQNKAPKLNLRKLTIQQANEIRELYAKGGIGTRALANQFGVSKPIICDIINGKRYKEGINFE